MATAHTKMSKSGAVESIKVGINTSVQYGQQGAQDRVTMKLTGSDRHSNTLHSCTWMTPAEAVQLAASLLLSAWELDTIGALHVHAKDFVEWYYEGAVAGGDKAAKHKVIEALRNR